MRGWIPAWLERCTCGTEKSYKADGEILAEFTPSEASKSCHGNHKLGLVSPPIISNTHFGFKFD